MSYIKVFNPVKFAVIEVSSGEYGSHTDKMVTAIDNGRSQRWRNYSIEDNYEDVELEELNTGVIERHNYKYESTPCQQFNVLLRRMFLQTVRNRVCMKILYRF